jgi:hypothetical protein
MLLMTISIPYTEVGIFDFSVLFYIPYNNHHSTSNLSLLNFDRLIFRGWAMENEHGHAS